MKKEKAVKKAGSEVRFIEIAKNIIFDHKAVIEIIQDPTLLGTEFQRILTYAEAEKAIVNLNKKGYAGYKDWRLPSVEELVGMTDRTKYNPCYDTNIFKGKFDDWYWSNESCAWNKEAAWCVTSCYGDVSYNGKGGRNYVRPVRSSQ